MRVYREQKTKVSYSGLGIHSRLPLVHRKSRGTKVGNAGPASDTDSTVRGGKRHGAGLLRPSSSPSPHTGSMPAVPQHHAERPGFVKPSSIKMPADGLEQLHWSSEERRNEVELHRQRRRAILCTKKAEMAVQVCGLLSALHSDKSAKELDMEESELRLKLESLLPLLSQRDDANSPPPEIPLNSAGPSTISNSGTQQAREELPSPVERPTPPDLQDLPTPHMAPEGGNNGALGTLLTPPCGQGNGPFGQYGDVGHQGDASLLGQGSPDGSSWGLGLPENPTALMGDEEVGHFDADDVVVLETWTCNW